MKLYKNLLVLFSFFIISTCNAQVYTYKNFNEETGLPSSRTSCVFQDSKSEIWIATSVGVTKYNGSRINNFRQTIVSQKNIIQIVEAQDSTLWFLSDDAKLYYYKHNQFYKFKYNQQISNLSFFPCVAIRQSLKLKNHIVSFKIKDVGVITIDSEGTIEQNKEILKHCKAGCVQIDKHKIVFDKNKLTVHKDSAVICTKEFNGIILWISKLKYGNIAIGFQNEGVKIYKDLKFDILKYELNNNYSASSVIQDLEGGIWVSTLENGVYYYPNINISILDQTTGLLDSKYQKISNYKNGIVIPSVKPAYQLFNFDSLQTFNIPYFTKFYKCSGVDYVDNKLFVGYYDKYLNSKSFIIENETIKWEKDIDFINVLKVKGEYYIISKLILHHLKNYKTHRVDKTVEFSKVFTLFENSDSTMLIATNIGLYNYNHQKFTYEALPIKDFSFNQPVNKIEVKDSTIWVATNLNGLVEIKGDTIKAYNQETGFSSNHVKDFLFVEDNIWVATDNGVFVYNLKDKTSINFDINNGLSSNKVNDIEIYKNNLFFATNNGIVYLNKNIKLREFYTSINKIYVNNKALKTTQNIIIPKSNNELKIEINAVSYACENKVMFQYKLKGYDKNWHQTNNKFVEYSNLPPGNYQFVYYAISKYGAKSKIKTIHSIKVESTFFDSIWFYVLIYFFATLFLGLIFYYVYKYRLQQLKRKVEVANKINKYRQQALSAQMNPHFIYNSLNSIQNYIVKNDTKKSREYLAKFGVLMRKILNNSQSSWITLEEEFEALKLYIEMELMRFRDSFEFNLTISEDIILSNIKVPPLLLQPYVENAIHHGLREKERDQKLEINVYDKHTNCIIEIIDNGIGREQSKLNKSKYISTYKSMGTSITEKRIKVFSVIYKSEFNVKTYDLKTKTNAALGTKVEIKLKIN